MIYQGDRFLSNGNTYLLLHCDIETDKAWAIDIYKQKGWPREFAWSLIRTLNPPTSKSKKGGSEASGYDATGLQGSPVLKSLNPTPAMIKVRDRAMALLGGLVDPQISYPRIFDASERGQMVTERAHEAGCSKATLYKHLRRYWLGGQKPSALLGKFHRCGHLSTVTNGRGARPEFERPIYQLTTADFERFNRAIEKTFLCGDLRSIAYTHQVLLQDHYTQIDGNGDELILPEGERPTFRQFQYYLLKTLPLEKRLRSRHGDKDYERDHRPVLGTVMDVCDGVGHIYEADATILDTYLVAAEDISKIIGKPTLFLIIDRKSRLIVGWYLGLENASWTVAMEAFVSISQDKQAICERLGIQYKASDWPAHEVFPKQVLADRSELFTNASSQLASELGTTVSNLPSQRPDWKPVVECQFKQTRMMLQPGAPGFDPPENAMKRQGKHYDKDACLTLKQLEKIVLAAIIAHNRKPLLDYPLTLKEIGHEVPPIPIALWNHDIVERSGLLPKFDEETVRMALLPRDKASISEEGIVFRGCYYSCQEALSKGWHALARKSRFKLNVAFDRRLVDRIYVFDPDGSGRHYECRLTSRSNNYRGMSFCEVYAIEKIQRRAKVGWKQTATQVKSDFNSVAEREYAEGKQALKVAGLNARRKARRADTKAVRTEELRAKRQEQSPKGAAPTGISSNVFSIAPSNKQGTQPSTKTAGEAQSTSNGQPMSAAEMMEQRRARMFSGKQ